MSGGVWTKATPGTRLESVTVNPCCVDIRKLRIPLGNREGQPVGLKIRVRIQHLWEVKNYFRDSLDIITLRRHIGGFVVL